MNSTLNMRTNLYFNRADEIKHKELVFTKEVLGWNTTAIILEATEAGSCRLKCKAGKHGSLACHTEEPCVAEQTTNYVNFSFLSSALVFLSKSSVSVHRFVEVPTWSSCRGKINFPVESDAPPLRVPNNFGFFVLLDSSPMRGLIRGQLAHFFHYIYVYPFGMANVPASHSSCMAIYAFALRNSSGNMSLPWENL